MLTHPCADATLPPIPIPPPFHPYLECPHVLQQWVGLSLVHQIDCPNVGALDKGNEGLKLRGRFEEEFQAHLCLLWLCEREGREEGGRKGGKGGRRYCSLFAGK